MTCACELQGSGAAAVKKKRPLGGLAARLGDKVGDVANGSPVPPSSHSPPPLRVQAVAVAATGAGKPLERLPDAKRVRPTPPSAPPSAGGDKARAQAKAPVDVSTVKVLTFAELMAQKRKAQAEAAGAGGGGSVGGGGGGGSDVTAAAPAAAAELSLEALEAQVEAALGEDDGGGKAGDAASPASAAETPRGGGVFAVGAPVLGKWGGGEDWFPGTVSAARGDGTYDVLYDDGDSEQGKPASDLVDGTALT